MSVEIQGVCDPRAAPLKAALAANFEDGLELGASMALLQDGEPLLDIWAGWADYRRSRPWTRETIAPLASTTKIATMLCLLMAIDRGLVELDAPVARYWPEFAQGGKGEVTVRAALSHTAGVPAFDPPVAFASDWDVRVANLAAQTHWFGGERRLCYHAATYGYLLGEILRRVDSRTPAQFFDEEVARPAGIDFQIGLRAEAELRRLSPWAALAPPAPAPPMSPLAGRLVTSVSPPDSPAERYGWPNQRRGNPAGGGNAGGLGIARLAAIFANGGVLGGRRYLSQALVDEATREQAVGDDPMFGELHMGLGFGLDGVVFPAPTPTSFHWGGQGGSLILGDQRTGVSFGYAPNNFIDSSVVDHEPRFERVWAALGEVMRRL
jgi:CubicO group peptidase (beta-lactamase class C family)